MAKKSWNIFHQYDVDGGFGDPVATEDLVATVEATDEEIKEFLRVWNKPEVYSRPYCDLYHHGVQAVEVKMTKLCDVVPYSNDPDDY